MNILQRMNNDFNTLFLTIAHVRTALIQAKFQKHHPHLDVPTHIAQHSCFCKLTDCPYHN